MRGEGDERVNILLVDDQPAKLMSYEVILREIDENLIKASSGREALELLLKSDIAVVRMGSWDWDIARGDCVWDEGQKRIFGVDPADFVVTPTSIRGLVHRDDWKTIRGILKQARRDAGSYQIEFRVCRPDGSVRWC